MILPMGFGVPDSQLPTRPQIPITGTRIGLDPVFGMMPMVGDAASLIIGGYIISVAVQYHLPKRAIALMLLSQAVEAAVGLVPFLGPWFRASWYAKPARIVVHVIRTATAAYANTKQRAISKAHLTMCTVNAA